MDGPHTYTTQETYVAPVAIQEKTVVYDHPDSYSYQELPHHQKVVGELTAE